MTLQRVLGIVASGILLSAVAVGCSSDEDADPGTSAQGACEQIIEHCHTKDPTRVDPAMKNHPIAVCHEKGHSGDKAACEAEVADGCLEECDAAPVQGDDDGGHHHGGSHAGGSHSGGSHAGGSHSGGSHAGGSHAGGSHSGGSHAGGSHSGGSHNGGSHAGGSHSGGSHNGGSHAGGSGGSGGSSS